NDLVTGLDKSKQIDAILLDFSKTFDKVPHQRLLLKLHHYGVRNKTLKWIESFLSCRSQQVLLDGVSSKPAAVTSGVPQGTVLGPLLFLAYINDMPECVKSICRLFADDSLLYKEINTPADAEALQEDLNKLQEWERLWLMEFNADKCEVLRISNKRTNINATYSIHGQTLQMTKKAKYLGVVMTPNMSWNAHVDMITQKANNTLAFLRRNVGSCPPSTKEACYKSLVRPQVEYASSVWDPPTKNLTQRVEMVQRRAARFVSGDYRRTSSVGAMLDSLGWDSLQLRRTQTKAIMMYRVVHGLVAIDLPAYMHPQGVSTRGHSYRYIPQYCRTQTMKGSYFPSTTLIWNQLPDSLVAAPSLEAFKTGIAAANM
ncbi:MAG: reverse transcriptase family protein, partial [Candidatus Thiodiazotropha taylori]|nr:reverse transcriptase family protein [Candidatus Thiodiazotropha taylori]MCW4307833.1 reverse transcriptase family protein [Candidatus Thiodiazotropha endolucinida]